MMEGGCGLLLLSYDRTERKEQDRHCQQTTPHPHSRFTSRNSSALLVWAGPSATASGLAQEVCTALLEAQSRRPLASAGVLALLLAAHARFPSAESRGSPFVGSIAEALALCPGLSARALEPCFAFAVGSPISVTVAERLLSLAAEHPRRLAGGKGKISFHACHGRAGSMATTTEHAPHTGARAAQNRKHDLVHLSKRNDTQDQRPAPSCVPWWPPPPAPRPRPRRRVTQRSLR